MNNKQIKAILRATIKKVYKVGIFHSFTLSTAYISFKDVHNNLYTLNCFDEVGAWFRVGRVEEWGERGLTFESEYQTMGMIDKCKFIDTITPTHTDNPDYILRICKAYNNIN